MPVFEQTFLRPGRYCVGRDAEGQPKLRDFSADELREYVDGTKGMLAAGYSPPVLLEHSAPNSDEGSPRDDRAAAVRHGVGWLTDVKIGTDGAAIHVLDVKDEDVAKQLKSGAIKFTSPELRPLWLDGKGKTHQKVISHVALTHKPRSVDQGPISLASMQFSLADLDGLQGEPPAEPVQFADDGDKVDPPAAPEPEKKSPDAPDTGPDADAGKFNDVLAHLKEIDLPLASDTTPENFIDRLLGALLVSEAAKKSAEAEDAEDDDEGDDPPGGKIEEEQPQPLQFSLSDAVGGKVPNKLLARVLTDCNERITAKLNGLVGSCKITPHCRDQLLAMAGAVQFSAEGEEVPRLSLTSFLDLLDKSLLPGRLLGNVTQMATEEEHPDGKTFFATKQPNTPPERGSDEAKALARQQLESAGFKKKTA
jgi:hypothetical protein